MTRPLARLFAAAAFAFTIAAAPASADTLVDNTAGSYDYYDLSNYFATTNACGCFPGFDSQVVDAFTLTSRSRLTGINAALVAIQQNPVSNFTGFADADGYRINIFSDVALTATQRIGDVFSTVVAPGAVSFGPSLAYTGDFAEFLVGSTLASLPVDVTLGSGTYWLSVVALNEPDNNESIGVLAHGTGAAVFANPGGAFGIPGDQLSLDKTAGYAVIGVANVPEPATWAVMIMGSGAVGGAARRRRRADAPLVRA